MSGSDNYGIMSIPAGLNAAPGLTVASVAEGGLTMLTNPVLQVEATDCGGNVGLDAHTFQGSLMLCGP